MLLEILQRNKIKQQIIDILNKNEENIQDITSKRGLYIYGYSGIGKTRFIQEIVKECGYNVIYYDAGNVRNKTTIENITEQKTSKQDILSLFNKKKQKMIIIMDEVDGLNSNDRGGINTLIKMIRPKKTKKQKKEITIFHQIICIGSYYTDKKILELRKVCDTIEIPKPTTQQVITLLKYELSCYLTISENEYNNIAYHVGGNIRTCYQILYHIKKDINIIKDISRIFHTHEYNENVKQIVHHLFVENCSIDEHFRIINETNRTIVSLLFHENIVDYLDSSDKSFYLSILQNICLGDYIDRITFQKQIWQLNELTFLMKVMHNQFLFHKNKKNVIKNKEIRFTKVLTRYSTEFNNYLFISGLCDKLLVDRSDMFFIFEYLKQKYTNHEIVDILQDYKITLLEVSRIIKFLNKIDNYDKNEETIEINDESDVEELFYSIE